MHLTRNHNLGQLSDRVFDTLELAVQNRHTSFTKNVWILAAVKTIYLSSTFKEVVPIIGNRICKDKQGRLFYLQININGQLINKIRI